MTDGPEWFAPKRYGYGAGLPISWQGWTVSVMFLALVAGLAFFFGDQALVVIALLVQGPLDRLASGAEMKERDAVGRRRDLRVIALTRHFRPRFRRE